MIDEANSEDPTRVTVDGQSVPYRWAVHELPRALEEPGSLLNLLWRLKEGSTPAKPVAWAVLDSCKGSHAPNSPGSVCDTGACHA